MIKKLFLVIICILTFFISDSAANNNRNILIINSYHKGLIWTDQINLGITEEITKNLNNVEFFIEYIDSKRFFGNEYVEKYIHFLSSKYENHSIDLIIVTDDIALSLIIKYWDKVPQQIPVVFCGINEQKPLPPGITGVFEEIDYVGNMELIKKLHPGFSKIYFVVDETQTGDIIYQKATQLLDSDIKDSKIEFLRHFSFEELNKFITTHDKNAVVFFTIYTKDSNNEYLSFENSITKIKGNLAIPFYGAWDFYANHGIIGGSVISGYLQGVSVAKLALRILAGESVNSIGPIIGPTYYFLIITKWKNMVLSEINFLNILK